MSWEKEVEELNRRRALAEKMGGAEKLARQKSRGKLNARERLAALLDEGSFREIGKIAGKGCKPGRFLAIQFHFRAGAR